MSKQEFIEGLRRNLSSINDYTFVNETISYYENYIDTQVRMGKSESEVMKELGDPRLIAKSIQATRVPEDAGEQDAYQEFGQNPYGGKKRSPMAVFQINGKQIHMPSWLIKTLGILILIVVFWVVYTVLRWLAPFIMVGVFSYFIYKLFIGKY